METTQDTPEELMKMADVANMLQVSYGSIRNWVSDKTLPYIQVRPRVIRFRRRDIEKLLKAGERGKASTTGGRA